MARPLFIVGTGRSGTTLLRALLNAHPDLHLSLESSFMLVARAKKYARSPDKELERYFRSVPFGWLRMERARITSHLSASASHGDAFRTLMEVDSARYGKGNWGDKTPAHWLVVDDLRRSFPDAVIIHLVRDPRSVVGSLLRMPWGSPSLVMNSMYVEWTLRALRPRTDIHHIRFEDLLQEPEKHLRFILDEVGLPWSDQILNHEQYSPNDVAGLPWLTQAYQKLSPYRGVRRLPPEQEPWVEWICGSAFSFYGYERYNRPLPCLSLVKDCPALVWSLWHSAVSMVAPNPDPRKELRRWLHHNKAAFQNYPGWDAKRVVEASLGS